MSFNSAALTFNDLRKRQAPDGTIDHITELLAESNPVINDIPWMQGNLPTGNQTTQRTGLPHGHLRQINRGVPAEKSSTRQVTDTCCLLEAHSMVDVEIMGLQPNPEAFRRSEDDAFLTGMSQQVAGFVFYGDSNKNLDEFNGLSVRYNHFGGNRHDASYQVINGGGTGTGKLSSAWLTCWGPNAVHGIYPKYGFAGFKMEDKGEQLVKDSDGNIYQALVTIFKWKPGLAVRDPEMVAAVRNIDLKAINAGAAADKKALVENMIRAQNRIRNFSGVSPVWYVSPELYTFLNLYFNDKNNVYITRAEAMGQMPEIRVNGVLVKREDSLVDTEDAIAEAK